MLGSRRGDQPPAYKRNKQDTRQCGDDADGGEIEHLERRAKLLFAEAGDNDIGWRADQRHQSAEDGGEGEWHQGEGGRAVSLGGGLHVNRHQQRQRPDIVHEG